MSARLPLPVAYRHLRKAGCMCLCLMALLVVAFAAWDDPRAVWLYALAVAAQAAGVALLLIGGRT